MKEIKNSHPEGKIQLMNGTILDCYPLEHPQDEVDNQLALDTTGVYLSIGGKKPVIPEENTNEQRETDRKKILENAFLFIKNRDRILSDSKMFLCPVPVDSAIAYTGTSGFRCPTLGIYVEWWLHCANANIMEKDGKKWLVYQIAGSPLSGSNRCGLVNQRGETKTQHISDFSSLWPLFQKINFRYDKAKSKYQAYTLREVLDIFQKENRTIVYKKDIYIYFLEQENKKLRGIIERERKINSHEFQEHRSYLLNLKRAELEAFYAEYQERQDRMQDRCAKIHVQRMELRKQMREGIIDHVQYQKLWTPLHREKNNMAFEIMWFEHETLQEICPVFTVSVYDVKCFLKGKDNG